jgi:hypothetical protein
MTTRCDVVGYHCFRGSCCLLARMVLSTPSRSPLPSLHPQDGSSMAFETRYPTAPFHGVTTRKTTTWSHVCINGESTLFSLILNIIVNYLNKTCWRCINQMKPTHMSATSNLLLPMFLAWSVRHGCVSFFFTSQWHSSFCTVMSAFISLRSWVTVKQASFSL